MRSGRARCRSGRMPMFAQFPRSTPLIPTEQHQDQRPLCAGPRNSLTRVVFPSATRRSDEKGSGGPAGEQEC